MWLSSIALNGSTLFWSFGVFARLLHTWSALCFTLCSLAFTFFYLQYVWYVWRTLFANKFNGVSWPTDAQLAFQCWSAIRSPVNPFVLAWNCSFARAQLGTYHGKRESVEYAQESHCGRRVRQNWRRSTCLSAILAGITLDFPFPSRSCWN